MYIYYNWNLAEKIQKSNDFIWIKKEAAILLGVQLQLKF